MKEPGAWFADRDEPGEEFAPGSLWRAWLQCDGFVLHLEGTAFATEADCLDFIRENCLGATLLDD